MNATIKPQGPEPDRAGMEAARRWAEWYLGSSSWGSDIVWAYLNPAEAMQRLSDEENEPIAES